MDEMEEYRYEIEKRYRNRRRAERYAEGGRRKDDYKSPPPYYWSDLWMLVPLVLSALGMLFLSGCAAVKKVFRGD